MRSIQTPPMAAERPSITIAMEKMIAIGVPTPVSGKNFWIKGSLITENAYTCPIDRWTARAAGGTSHRLKPGGAMVWLRSRRFIRVLPGTGPVVTWVGQSSPA